MRAAKRPATPQRPLVWYYGGKWRLADWIISFFPPHVCYVEPFCGAASVLLRKQPSRFEYINDKDEEIFNLFRILRERPEDLIQAIERTPYSRRELHRSYEPTADPVEKARRFYVRACQGRGHTNARQRTGWRYNVSAKRDTSFVAKWNKVGHLWTIAERLKSVGIECDDALRVLKRFDNETTLFYVDPPYLGSTRYTKSYTVEFHTEEEHRQLANALKGLKGMAVLSGYASELYEELYERDGWVTYSKYTHNVRGTKATERIWLNPKAAAGVDKLLFKLKNQTPDVSLTAARAASPRREIPKIFPEDA